MFGKQSPGKYKVDPRTEQVSTMQVHLYMDFFSKYSWPFVSLAFSLWIQSTTDGKQYFHIPNRR